MNTARIVVFHPNLGTKIDARRQNSILLGLVSIIWKRRREVRELCGLYLNHCIEEDESSVVDPQWIQCGSGSRNYLYADLDTRSQINADPDPGQTCCKSLEVEFLHENIQYCILQ